MSTSNWSALIGFILVSEGAGIVGSLFTVQAIPGWYATLVRPELTPPSWVFGPVWTTLYLLMGIAAFLVWRKGSRRHDVRTALGFFGLQLVLNAFWSIIFFGWHNLGGALVEIVFLWLAIVATIVTFTRVSRRAAWLLVPYLAWVSFATYLTYALWSLNA